MSLFKPPSEVSLNEENPKSKRPICTSCKRPEIVCWCMFLPKNRIYIDTTITILQHPYEEARKIQTARILELSIVENKFRIIKARKFNLFGPKDTKLAILFPTKDALPLNDLGFQPDHLIVIDGTWNQAKGIYWSNKCLHDIPKVTIGAPNNEIIKRPSEFVIRKQPDNTCVSTVEAVGRALLCIENPEVFNDETYDRLISPLRYICQVQLNHGAVVHEPKTIKL